MSELQPGTILDGKYRVERTIGSGGMGYVVAAHHLQLDQTVALKFMRPGVLEGDESRKRFYREAKASARLKSEHVARVLDVGTLPDGDPYMVMEYLEGKDLSVIARERGALPLTETCDYVLQACDALAEAHAMGVVHRDVKLANLFVSTGPTGAPLLKVLDFGISKATPFAATDLEVTTTAAMLGSPRFMAPEQMRDPRDVDARSDVWSLGVILYRLSSGRAPFDSETLGRLFSMVMHEPPPPLRSIAPDLPPEFEALVMRCLEKDRAGRVQSVAELARGLVPFASNPARAQQMAEKAALLLSTPSATQSGAYGAPPSAPASSSVSAGALAYGPPSSGFNPPRMPSGPPGSNETADGAAWGQTSARRRPPHSLGSLAATVGLLACALALAGIAIRARYKHDEPARPAAAALAGAAAQPSPPGAAAQAGSAPSPQASAGAKAPSGSGSPAEIPTVSAESLPMAADQATSLGGGAPASEPVARAAQGSAPAAAPSNALPKRPITPKGAAGKP